MRSNNPPVIDLWVLSGRVYIDMDVGTGLSLEITSEPDSVPQLRVFEENSAGQVRATEQTVGEEQLKLNLGSGAPDLVVKLWLGPDTEVDVFLQGVTENLRPEAEFFPKSDHW